MGCTLRKDTIISKVTFITILNSALKIGHNYSNNVDKEEYFLIQIQS